jgi:hypothetical protein
MDYSIRRVFTWFFYGENHAASDSQVYLSTVRNTLSCHQLLTFFRYYPFS